MQMNSVNGPATRTVWVDVDWRQAQRRVRNLRRRIFRASKSGDMKSLRSLQKLALRSRSAALMSVRQVTQVNAGRTTPGVDKLVVDTVEARGALVDSLCSHQPWRASPVRRVYIPKANGKKRPLGIPTIFDRAMQAVVRTALEPEWEAHFEPCSYGFRAGRGCHDAISRIYSYAVPNGRKKWVLDADIEGAFDNIGHDALINAMGGFPGRALVRQWLKAGFVENDVFSATDAGTPQGGVISPLLANIAFHGMETAMGLRYNNRGETISRRGLVRYADDFVVFCETEADAYAARAEMAAWLAPRGLRLSEKKTRITHLSEGFDFLGYNVRQYPAATARTGWKLLIKPSREAVRKVRTRLREDWRKLRGQNITAVLKHLNPVIRGWANYHRIVVAKEIFAKLDYWMFDKQVRWARRTHPKKPWRWIKRRYWGRLRPSSASTWVFGDALDSGAPLYRFAWTPIVRHVMVKGRNSPDDPNLDAYWEFRARRRHGELPERQRILAQRQSGLCLHCGASLHNDEALFVHRTGRKRRREVDDFDSLQLLHRTCHQQAQAIAKRARRRKRIA
jgi:RNA-directed DNA polymerase